MQFCDVFIPKRQRPLFFNRKTKFSFIISFLEGCIKSDIFGEHSRVDGHSPRSKKKQHTSGIRPQLLPLIE